MKKWKIFGPGLWVLVAVFFAGCSPAVNRPDRTSVSPTQVPAQATPVQKTDTPEPSPQEPLAQGTSVIEISPAPADTVAPTNPSKPGTPGSVRSALDSDQNLTPAEVARQNLAYKLKISPGLIQITSEGASTLDPVPCQLGAGNYTGVNPAEMSGPHQQVLLTYRNTTYEYWVFTPEGDLPIALPCTG